MTKRPLSPAPSDSGVFARLPGSNAFAGAFSLALLNPKALTGFSVTLAQVTLNDQMGKVAGILNLVGLIIFFGGMLMSAVMYMLGRTEQMKYALVGSGIGGMAWVIVKTFFETSGQTMNVDLQPVN